jgi:hypothetical protein
MEVLRQAGLNDEIKPGHAIRKQEYWTIKDLGIKQVGVIFNNFSIAKT